MEPDAATEGLRQALPGVLGNLDPATFEAMRPHLRWEWVERGGGEILFRQGDPTDSLYLVISGRLQASVADADGRSHVVGEIGRGESVGEMGAFTGKPRQATVVALRDTILARIELSAFHAMLKASPAVALNLNRMIIERLERRNAAHRQLQNATNIAVLCTSAAVDAAAIGRLVAELQRQQQRVLHLTTAMIDAAAGRAGAAQCGEEDSEGHRWLVQYLDRLEEQYARVFYQADPTLTAWTRRCLRVADEIVLLADAAGSPELSEVESACLNGSQNGARLRQTLVLLHSAGTEYPAGTSRFLAVRPTLHRHYHVRMEVAKDVARLARFMSNTAVGLVLAGGGARGLAHIGVYRALEEAGIAVDAVGGTSIGSIMGASIAMGWDWQRVASENRRHFLSHPTRDYNWLPLVSLLSGKKLERLLDDSPVSGKNIEDLWLPFYCVSCNFTQACEHVHRRGNLKRAVMASMAIPGVFPPVVEGNDLLVDGGLFNNMPVDVMASLGAATILGVDLRRQDKPRGPLNFDRVPGTWALLLDRLRRRERRRYAVPSMLALLVATPTLSSAHKTKAVVGDVDLLFNPAVSGFGMLDWKSFDTLVELGYEHARQVLAARGDERGEAPRR